MKEKPDFWHTILGFDADEIYETQLKIKKVNKIIICDHKHYFYDDDDICKEDFQKLETYFNDKSKKD